MRTDSEYMSDLQKLISCSHNFLSNLSRSRKYADLKAWIINKTNPLLDDPFYTLSNRIFYLINGFNELPKCANPKCNKTIKRNFTLYTDRNKYYLCHCCNRCTQLDPNVQKKIEQTTLSRYNCKRGNHSDAMYEKIRKTCLERYGVDNPQKSKDIRKKTQDTLMKKYGVLNSPFESSTVRSKTRQTFLDKYGVDNPLKTKEVQKKIRQTVKKKYGVDCITQSVEVQKKIHDTMVSRYGSSSYLGTEECKEKTKAYCNAHFGVDYVLQIPEVRNKIKQTNMQKYGHEIAYAYGTEEFDLLVLKKYGVDHISKSSEIRKLQAYRYIYNGISFDSAPEIAFYIWLNDVKDILDIDFEYSPDVKFRYEYGGKTHYYMPDFRVENQYFEIKGDHFFKDGKMVNPFRDPSWSDEQYADECARYEAKRQCMVDNGVHILRNSEYSFFMSYVSEKYGKDHISKFKNTNT